MFIDSPDYVFRNNVQDGFVDKSGLISFLNTQFGGENRFVLVSRPRRFGKTMAIRMLNAYYSKRLNTKEIFDKLVVSKSPSYKEHLNQHNVLYIDMRFFAQSEDLEGKNFISNLTRGVCEELKKFYLNVLSNEPCTNIKDALVKIYSETSQRFIILIDEWDYALRVFKNQKITEAYIDLLRELFKSQASDCIELAYMTGILPIKRYNSQSDLNNFNEYTMIEPSALAPYFGFTTSEVQMLCQKYNLPFDTTQKWYDGYKLNGFEIYNPRAIMRLCASKNFVSYWTQTGSMDVITDVLKFDLYNVRADLLNLYEGNEISSVNFNNFNCDVSELNSRDAIITFLVHLGYLAFDAGKKSIYIPNQEIRIEIKETLKKDKYPAFMQKYQDSLKLIKDINESNAEAVARYIEKLHNQVTSIIRYNNEDGLRYVLLTAMYAADEYYQVPKQEYPSGKGFADLVFIPKHGFEKQYATIVIELKWNQSANTALEQIKERNFTQDLEGTSDAILLVGINYDTKSKIHSCEIEAMI